MKKIIISLIIVGLIVGIINYTQKKYRGSNRNYRIDVTDGQNGFDEVDRFSNHRVEGIQYAKPQGDLVEGDISYNGKSIFRNGAWVPIRSEKMGRLTREYVAGLGSFRRNEIP